MVWFGFGLGWVGLVGLRVGRSEVEVSSIAMVLSFSEFS